MIRVTGWAASGARSTILHALPSPGAIGTHTRAVCGKLPSVSHGWEEPTPNRRIDRCSVCAVTIEANG